ncbi:hypothetical protein RJ641_033154 [Dillenia turbinata]|uniref:Uncharacterized protein n=1 Tax=Dillenia turbinata TaxID=194707 RepID=A0AAN8VQP0_9MAGN
MSRMLNIVPASGILAFAGAGLSFFFYMASSKKPVIDPTKPLHHRLHSGDLTSILVPVTLDLIIKLTQK